MEQKMVQNTKLTKMIFWAMMVAVGVVISPLLRIEGMCPMAHFINVTCAVLLGIGNWTYPHGIYGHSAACTDGGGIRRGAVRHFIPGIKGKDYFCIFR